MLVEPQGWQIQIFGRWGWFGGAGYPAAPDCHHLPASLGSCPQAPTPSQASPRPWIPSLSPLLPASLPSLSSLSLSHFSSRSPPSRTHPLFIFLPPSGPCWYCNHPDARWLLSSPSRAHTLTHTQCAIPTSPLLLISSDVCLMNTKRRCGGRAAGRLARSPPEGNLRGRAGGGGAGRGVGAAPQRFGADKSQESEDVTCYRALLLAARGNLHLKITEGEGEDLPFVVRWWGGGSGPGLHAISHHLSYQDGGLTEVRLRRALSLIGFSVASLNRFKEPR